MTLTLFSKWPIKIFLLIVAVWVCLMGRFYYVAHLTEADVTRLIRVACEHDASQAIGFKPTGGLPRQIGCEEAVQLPRKEVAYVGLTIYSSRAPSFGLFETVVHCKYRAELVDVPATCETFTDAL